MKRRTLLRAAAALLAALLLGGLIAGCAAPVTGRELAAAALGPAAVSVSAASSYVSSEGGPATLPCYFDPRSGVQYYVCEDCQPGSGQTVYTLRCFYLSGGALLTRTLATKTILTDASGQSLVNCRDAAGRVLTDTEYAAYADRYFAGFLKATLTINGQSALPAPAAAATPIPAPAPTAAPTPRTTTGPAVVITKNPTSESLAIGGTTWFIARATNADTLTWQVVSPDGRIYTTAEALRLHPGLKLDTQGSDTLAVRSVPLSLNGWGFQARFDGPGGTAVTTAAYVYVGDYVTAYQSVLSAYRAAYQYGGHSAQYARDNGLSEIIAHSAHIGYAFKDLDKDGTPELFLGGIGADDMARYIVYDVYTLIGGYPKRLAVSAENDRYYLCTDSLLFNGGSVGPSYAHYFLYRFENGVLSPVEGYLSSFTGSDRDGYYYRQGAYTPEPRDGDSPLTRVSFDNAVHTREATVFSLLLTQLD